MVGRVVERLELIEGHLLPLRGVLLDRSEGRPLVRVLGQRFGLGVGVGVVEGDERVLFDPVEPLALVDPAVLPVHLAVAVAVVVLEVADVLGSVFPDVGALAVLLVVHVLALVGVAVDHLPHSSSVPHPRQELSAVVGAVLPVVLAVAFGTVGLVPADVEVAICEDLQSFLLLLALLAESAHEEVARVVLGDAESRVIDLEQGERDLEALAAQDARLLRSVVGEETGGAALLPGLGSGGELAVGEPADEEGLGGLEDALAVPQPLLELAQVELLLVDLEPVVLLVVPEAALEALAGEVVQDALLLAAVEHLAEEDAVLVLLERVGPVHLRLLFLQEDLLVAAVEAHVLLLRPLGGGLVRAVVGQVHAPLEVALHLELDALQRVVEGQLVGAAAHLLLHQLEVLPEAVETLHHHRVVPVEVPHHELEVPLLPLHAQRLTTDPTAPLAAAEPTLRFRLRCLDRSVALEGLLLLALALVLGDEEGGLGNVVLLDLDAAQLLVEEGVPLRCVVDEAVVEQALPSLIGSRPDLREPRGALQGLLSLRGRPLLLLPREVFPPWRLLRNGDDSGEFCVEGGLDADLFGQLVLGGEAGRGIGVAAVVSVERVLAVRPLSPSQRRLVAVARHQQQSYYYMDGTITNRLPPRPPTPRRQFRYDDRLEVALV